MPNSHSQGLAAPFPPSRRMLPACLRSHANHYVSFAQQARAMYIMYRCSEAPWESHDTHGRYMAPTGIRVVPRDPWRTYPCMGDPWANTINPCKTHGRCMGGPWDIERRSLWRDQLPRLYTNDLPMADPRKDPRAAHG